MVTGHDTTLKNGRFCVQFCLFHIYPHKEDVRERTFPLIFAEKMAAPAQTVTTSDKCRAGVTVYESLLCLQSSIVDVALSRLDIKRPAWANSSR